MREIRKHAYPMLITIVPHFFLCSSGSIHFRRAENSRYNSGCKNEIVLLIRYDFFCVCAIYFRVLVLIREGVYLKWIQI